MKRGWAIGVALSATLAALPADVLACPVCFAAPEAPITQGLQMAILALLGVTAVVLGGFAAFFVCLARRARLADEGRLGPPGAVIPIAPHLRALSRIPQPGPFRRNAVIAGPGYGYPRRLHRIDPARRKKTEETP